MHVVATGQHLAWAVPGGADQGGAGGPGGQQVPARRVPHLHLRPQVRGVGHPGRLVLPEQALLGQRPLAHSGEQATCKL